MCAHETPNFSERILVNMGRTEHTMNFKVDVRTGTRKKARPFPAVHPTDGLNVEEVGASRTIGVCCVAITGHFVLIYIIGFAVFRLHGDVLEEYGFQ